MSLLATLMQELRSAYTNQFDGNELRPSRYGALDTFMQQTQRAPIFDPETIANIAKSYNNTVEVPVLDAQAITISTPYTRTCAIADDENDSAIVSLTFQSYGWRFSMTPATHFNNDVSRLADFQRKFEKYRLEFEKVLDSACNAQLETDKNAFWTGITEYANVGDALQVPAAEALDFYNVAESIMAKMDFYGNVDIPASTNHMPFVRRYENQADGNAINESFQFDLRGYRWMPTNRIVPGGGVNSTGFLVEDGTCYIHNRNDADTVMGHSAQGGGKVWGQESVQLGNGNMVMGTYFQEDCADRSAIAGAATAGNTRSLVQGFEFSTDMIFATKYNSDPATRYNPIVKFEFIP